jgi:hypothetical protein
LIGFEGVLDFVKLGAPSLSSDRALLSANVALQIIKGMRTLYSESEARPLIEAEFRNVLTSYLEGVLSEGKPAR